MHKNMNHYFSIYQKIIGAVLTGVILNTAPVLAQNSNDILKLIEQNNTQIEAARKALSATITENKTGLNLKNPEVEWEHKWVSHTGGTQTNEVSVTQELDWSVISGQRKTLSRKKNELAEITFLQTRNSVLLQAEKKLIELSYYYRLLDELHTQLQDADSLTQTYKTMLENGNGNILNVNRSQLNSVAIQTEIKNINTQKEVVMEELSGLNGGKPVNYKERFTFRQPELPEDFDTWFKEIINHVPELRYYQKDIEVKKQSLQSTKTDMIPGLSVGYAGEINESERLHGFILGMSIPLWENKNKLKKSKQDIITAQSNEYDAKQRVYSQLKAQYTQVIALRHSLHFQKDAIDRLNTTSLMKEALQKGEINLMDYLTEIARYYEFRKNLLITEKDYLMALADLYAFEL